MKEPCENQNPRCSGALVPVEGPQKSNIPQPRQPRTLEGLMKFALEATKSEDAPEDSKFSPMDEERRKFLESTLKAMTVNVIDVLQKNINILNKARYVKTEDDILECTLALSVLALYIEKMETAIDFHKIGGFEIFIPCFKSPSNDIRSYSLCLLAECVQNNPYCQQVVIDTGLLEHLLDLVQIKPHDEDSADVQAKALYAVSCTVRDHIAALARFRDLMGPTKLIPVLKNGTMPSKARVAFFLARIVESDPDVNCRVKLIEAGVIPLLCELIPKPRSNAHEHYLELLHLLVKDCPETIAICKQPKLRLHEILTKYLKSAEGRDDMQEEATYCNFVLNALKDPPQPAANS